MLFHLIKKRVFIIISNNLCVYTCTQITNQISDNNVTLLARVHQLFADYEGTGNNITKDIVNDAITQLKLLLEKKIDETNNSIGLVQVHIHVHVVMHVHVHVVYVQLYMYMYTKLHRTCTGACTCIDTCTCTCTLSFMYRYMYMYMYTKLHRTCTDTCTCSYKCTCTLSFISINTCN